MNRYLQSMKDTITAYHNKARVANAAINKAIEKYKPDVAREQADDIRAQLSIDKAIALDAIRSAYRCGVEENTGKWEHIQGEDITPDAKLLDSGIDITQAQYDELCRKYKNAGNSTMCKILADYAERNNKRRAQENPGKLFPPGYLTTRELPSPEANAKEWERAVKAAEHLINDMEGNGWMNGPENTYVINSVEHFGENLEL